MHQRHPEQNLAAPLKHAIEIADQQLCERLVEAGADLQAEYKSLPNCVPLLYCLSCIHDNDRGPELAEYLFSRGASIAGETSIQYQTRGYTAFHYAAANGFTDLLRKLHQSAPKAWTELSRSPIHPIHLAVAREHIDCVQYILQQSQGLSLVRIR